jgi:hypothetical protein
MRYQKSMSDRVLNHYHNWVIVSTVTQPECERWHCIVCDAKRIRVAPESPLVDVTSWSAERHSKTNAPPHS